MKASTALARASCCRRSWWGSWERDFFFLEMGWEGGDEEGDEDEGTGSGDGKGDPIQQTTVYEDFHLHKPTLALLFLHFSSALQAARNLILQHQG